MTARSNIERALARRFSPLAQFRMMRGLKQCEIAARAQIHETIVSKIERGMRLATECQISALATALRTTRRRMVALLFDSRQWARGSRVRMSSRS